MHALDYVSCFRLLQGWMGELGEDGLFRNKVWTKDSRTYLELLVMLLLLLLLLLLLWYSTLIQLNNGSSYLLRFIVACHLHCVFQRLLHRQQQQQQIPVGAPPRRSKMLLLLR